MHDVHTSAAIGKYARVDLSMANHPAAAGLIAATMRKELSGMESSTRNAVKQANRISLLGLIPTVFLTLFTHRLLRIDASYWSILALTLFYKALCDRAIKRMRREHRWPREDRQNDNDWNSPWALIPTIVLTLFTRQLAHIEDPFWSSIVLVRFYSLLTNLAIGLISRARTRRREEFAN